MGSLHWPESEPESGLLQAYIIRSILVFLLYMVYIHDIYIYACMCVYYNYIYINIHIVYIYIYIYV